MGRGNKKYRKTLEQQAYETLKGMLALGESKREAVKDGAADKKIFSVSTYKTYKKQIRVFLSWMKENHPEVTTLKKARKYVLAWLYLQEEKGLSAYTLHTRAKAVGKLFGIRPGDPDYYKPPTRRREDIKRSRGDAVRDKHFSEKNNDELIKFCRAIGARRNVLERLEGRDLWTRAEKEEINCQMEKLDKELFSIKNKKRILIERANADRGIIRKKSHDGYLILQSKKWREHFFQPDLLNGNNISRSIDAWRTTIQTPYLSCFTYREIRKQISFKLICDILMCSKGSIQEIKTECD